MEMLVNPSSILSAIVFSFIGLSIFAFGFWSIDRFTPYHLWKEVIEEKNIALAIVVGAISIGICNIIAAAIQA